MSRADQAARRAKDWEAVRRVDSHNTARLKQIIAGSGWPTISVAGQDGSMAAWLLAQHADADPAFQSDVLKMMEPLIATDEVSGTQYAYLYDRTHTPQRFGTQGRCTAPGSWVPREIEDRDEVDKRRAKVGRPPLDEYVRLISEDACKPQKEKAQ